MPPALHHPPAGGQESLPDRVCKAFRIWYAPTAGLHFTPELLEEIKAEGVEIAHVTLHVGLGTFRPVKADDILDHHMHSEFYRIEASEAEKINRAKRERTPGDLRRNDKLPDRRICG